MSNFAQQSAICLAVLLCADAICRPEPPAASPIALVPAHQEAAPPATDDDGAGLSHETESVHLNTLPALDFPPDAGAEPDAAIEPARGSVAVETYATTDEPERRPAFVSTVAPYTSCANGSCGVRYVPRQPVYQVRRRLFGGRFRR